MKYLRRYLIRAGLCLLLVCSADGASAQVLVGLGDVETTRTSMGRTIIDFNVNLSRRLMDSEVLVIEILSFDIDSRGSITVETDYAPTNCSIDRITRLRDDTVWYRICMDAGDEQDLPIRLALGSSSDTLKTIEIAFSISNSRSTVSAQRDSDNDILSIPSTAIFIRSKVFLEGPLQ